MRICGGISVGISNYGGGVRGGGVKGGCISAGGGISVSGHNGADDSSLQLNYRYCYSLQYQSYFLLYYSFSKHPKFNTNFLFRTFSDSRTSSSPPPPTHIVVRKLNNLDSDLVKAG